jgi:hypothetical protein
MNSRSSSRQKIEPVSKPDQDVAQDQQTTKPAEFKNDSKVFKECIAALWILTND